MSALLLACINYKWFCTKTAIVLHSLVALQEGTGCAALVARCLIACPMPDRLLPIAAVSPVAANSATHSLAVAPPAASAAGRCISLVTAQRWRKGAAGEWWRGAAVAVQRSVLAQQLFDVLHPGRQPAVFARSGHDRRQLQTAPSPPTTAGRLTERVQALGQQLHACAQWGHSGVRRARSRCAHRMHPCSPASSTLAIHPTCMIRLATQAPTCRIGVQCILHQVCPDGAAARHDEAITTVHKVQVPVQGGVAPESSGEGSAWP